MNVKSIVVEQLDWDATSKSLILAPDHLKELWVAFPNDYDEPRNGPFYFQDPKYNKNFNRNFARCQSKKVSKNNFYKSDDVFVYKTTWQNIITERNSMSYYAFYLPEFAVPVDIKILDPFTEGKQYKRTVFKDSQQSKYIVYLQCASRFGYFSFELVCKFQFNKNGFIDSSYSDEYQQDFYARPDEWKYFLNDIERGKVEQYLITNNNYNVMGDQYNINQAGAVGPNAVANNTVFNHEIYSLPDSIDYDLLFAEIVTLKKSLLSKVSSAEHFTALAELTSAEEAAKSRDGQKVVNSLKKAGKWALDGVKDIGTNLLAEIIKSQMLG